MSVWLNYYAARMRLSRELGLMTLDDQGRWVDVDLPSSAVVVETVDGEPVSAADAPLPPEIPIEWIEIVDPSSDEPETPFVGG